MHRSVMVNQSHGFWSTLKRTIFMASLYFRLIQEYDPDEALLREFNKIFYLVINPKSLSFPAMICPLLWNEKMVEKVVVSCMEGNIKYAAEIVYGRTPKWLRYLDRETMVRDTEKVISRYTRENQYA